MISRKRVIAVCTPLTVVSRSSLMSAIITFMFEPAKLQMNCASASGRINLRAEVRGGSTATAELTFAAPSPEGVDPAPSPWDVEQLEVADGSGERRVDQQVLPLRL